MPQRYIPAQPQSYAPPANMQWQASGPAAPPAKVRGVSADPVAKFVLPSPQALGVSTSLSLPQPTAAKVDWNQIQTRMERLKVLAYDKDRPQPGVVRVKMLVATADPTRGLPVEAQAETEAAAIGMALDAAEAWLRKQ